MSDKRRNLVIIHLESVNNLVFMTQQKCFPNIKKRMPYIEQYNNYYSTSTSTFMVITDLLYGNSSLFESSQYLEDIFSVVPEEKNLFGLLQEDGYTTWDFHCVQESRVKLLQKVHGVINRDGKSWFGDDIEAFSENVEKAMNSKNPFAFFINDASSAIAYNGERVNKELNVRENYFNRFLRIDETVGIVFDKLEEHNLLENTFFVIYGDHGDDYWYHGYHEGYTHAIEPYNNIVRCPLLLYNSGNCGENTSLISTTDIYSLILNKLGYNYSIKKREYVFSRNLFAAQTRKRKVFNKAYSVTEGTYTFLVSEDGIGLYLNELDPLNLTNLLQMFYLKNDKLVYRKILNNMMSSHYKAFMNETLKEEIQSNYILLKEKMNEYLQTKTDLIFKPAFSKVLKNKNMQYSWIQLNCRKLYKFSCNCAVKIGKFLLQRK